MPSARALRGKAQAPQVIPAALVVDAAPAGGRLDPASPFRAVPGLSI